MDLHACGMLQVFLASLGDFFAWGIRGKRFHARAQESLAAKNVRILLPMGNHHSHVVVVNAIVFGSMAILRPANELPVASQIFKRKEVVVKLFNLHLAVCLIDRLPSKFLDYPFCVFIAQNDIDGFKTNGAGSDLASNQKLEQSRWLFIQMLWLWRLLLQKALLGCHLALSELWVVMIG